MTVAIALILVVATIIPLSYPWLRPRVSASRAGASNSRSRSIDTLEEDIEKDIKRLRQTVRQTHGTCRKCGAEYPKEGRFCPQCGTKL